MAEPPPLDDLEFYKLIRSRLEHEDSLIVNRLSWLVASQSFLFTAYAIVLNGLAGPPASQPVFDRQRGFLRLIPIVGIAAAGLIYAGILAAIRAMAWLRATFRARVPDERSTGLPSIHAPASIRAQGMVAPTLLPVVFLLAWFYLFVVAR